MGVADLVRQLFAGYPAERIQWWCCLPSAYSCPSGLQVERVHRLRLPKKLEPQRRLTLTKSFLLERVWVPLAARHLRHTVALMKPDLVWVLLFGWPILVADRARLGRDLCLHASLWDLPAKEGTTKVLGEARTRRFVDATFQLVRRADSYDGISEAMLEEISQRTGKNDGILVHSGFETHHLRDLAASSATAEENVIRLAYVGTIISEPDFLQMLAALEKVRKTLTKPVILEFFGARNYQSQSWFNPQWMIEHGIFSDRELIKSLQRCSWGIVVVDLAAEDPRYSRFSFPNKIGTYLSAGVPILGFSHENSSLTAMLRKHAVGNLTSARHPGALEKFLSDSLLIPQPRSRFREAILRCANTEFNAEKIRNRLWQRWGVKGI